MERQSIRETAYEEIIAQKVKKGSEYPFMSGIIRGAGELHFSTDGFVLEIRHKDKRIPEKCAEVLLGLYGITFGIEKYDFLYGKTHENIFGLILPLDISADLLQKCRIVRNKYEFVDGIEKDFLETKTAKNAYLRGLFLACGSVKVPEEDENGKIQKSSGYTLSLNLNSDKVKDDVIKLLAYEAFIDEKSVRQKKNSNYIYIKNSEGVCNVLTALGCVQGALGTYEIIAERQVLNNVNRVHNCDLANIDKTVRAVGGQIAAIDKLMENGEYEKLSDELKKTCILRKKFPDIGLEQLAKEFTPPIGKSCLNHRLRRLIELAGKSES